eukprot:scaffold5581_cov156-Skeletonema_marinoi.AAC.23
MIRTLITILALLGLPATLMAFSAHPIKIMTRQSPAATTTTLYYHPAVFEKAVECAQNYGMCDVDELLNLAEQLDQYNGCYYEDEAEACQKEIDDRHDLVDVLLLQTELQQRDDYTKKANLFAHDVKADKDMHDRDNFIDNISPEMDV